MENGQILHCGNCGNDVFYFMYETDGGFAVNLYGKGDMPDYDWPEGSPFTEFRDEITDVTVGRGITGIGANAFRECTKLRAVSLPGTVRYLGPFCFSYCDSLTSVVLPEGLEIIGPKAFERSMSLSGLTLPSTLKAIDFKAFYKNESLMKISYNGTARQWRERVSVSESCEGCKALLGGEFTFADETAAYRKMLGSIAKTIKKGGDGRMHILFPDITTPGCPRKSGDCTFIVFPDGQTMMIDAGVDDAEPHVRKFLSFLDIDRLDYFVLSHPHKDHAGSALPAMKYLIEERGGSVGHFHYSGFETKLRCVHALIDYLRDSGTALNCAVRAGDTFDIGPVHAEAFNPDDEVLSDTGSSDSIVNDTSVAYKFTFGESTFLTAGDLYAGRELTVASRYGDRLHADVAKSDHHGNYTSNTPEWYGAVKPKYVISEEDGVTWTMLEERFAREGIKHFRVSECGLTIVSMDEKKGYRIRTEYGRKR